MKNLLSVLILIPLGIFAQDVSIPDGDRNHYHITIAKDTSNVKNDSIVKKEKLFFNPGWKKHNHIVDFSSYIGFIFINLNSPGALGYRYLYSTNWNYTMKFGARTGFWFYKSGEDVPKIMSRTSMTYSTFFVVNGPIWKSFNWEASLGYSNYISWPTRNNTFDNEKYYYGSSYWLIKSGINSIYFKHLCLDINFEYIYDTLGKSWFPGVSLTVGYKF